MDSREAPQQHQQPPQQQQQQSMNMLNPNSYPTSINNNNNNNTSGAMIGPPNTGRFQFNPVPAAQQPAAKPMDSQSPSPFDGSLRPSGSGGGFSIDGGKKKRGRPRKYSPDGNIALGLATQQQQQQHQQQISVSPAPAGVQDSDPPAKKNRGRPPGSGKKQLDALGAAGVGFTPHVIMVQAGEDIASKVMSFSQQGPRTVCILSANGPVSNVVLRQPSMSGGTVTYEGRYEIISLSGSYLFSENNGNRRSGGLSVSLAGSDGSVLGGGVGGMLVAAGPVQVIVGSFIAEGKKSSSNLLRSGPSSPPPSQMLNFGAPMTAASPSSQQASSNDTSDENGSSPLNRAQMVLYSNPNQPIHNMGMYHPQLWAGQTQQ